MISFFASHGDQDLKGALASSRRDLWQSCAFYRTYALGGEAENTRMVCELPTVFGVYQHTNRACILDPPAPGPLRLISAK